MTIVYATDEMKKDVESLISIAREDNIEAEKVYLIFHLVRPGLSSKSVEKYLNREIAVSEVIGQDLVTKKRNLLNIY
jgi:hypothetical protein